MLAVSRHGLNGVEPLRVDLYSFWYHLLTADRSAIASARAAERSQTRVFLVSKGSQVFASNCSAPNNGAAELLIRIRSQLME